MGATRTDEAAGSPPGAPPARDSSDDSEAERPYVKMAHGAQLFRLWNGHVLNLLRLASHRQATGELTPTAGDAGVQEMVGATISHVDRTRMPNIAAKFEMIWGALAEGIGLALGDTYFRQRPLDRKLLISFAETYANASSTMGSTRIGDKSASPTVHHDTPLEEAVELDSRFLAQYSLPSLTAFFRELATCNQVLSDFLTDMDRGVWQTGYLLDEPPEVLAVPLQSHGGPGLLREVFLVRRGGDVVGVWDDEDDALADYGYHPVRYHEDESHG